MVLRLTSRNVKEARPARDENPMEAGELQGHHDRRSPRVMRDSFAGPRDPDSQKEDLGSQKINLDSHKNDIGSGKKQVVAADLALDWVLQEIVQQARLATTATGAFIGITRARNILCQAISGSNTGELVAYLNRDRRMLDSCLSTNTPQRCRDSETSDEVEGSACRYLGARSIVLVPVIDASGKNLGIFGVFSPQVDAFSNANIVALQTLSLRIADARAQIDRCTSVAAGSASGRGRAESGKPVRTYERLLRAAQRPLPVGAGTAVWILGMVAVVLLGCWIFVRAMNQRAMPNFAKAPAITSPPASLLTPPSSSHSSSSGIGTNPSQSPAPQGVVTHSPEISADGNRMTNAPVVSKAGTKVSARAKLRVPDLEIENTLDDVPSGSLRSESVDTSRAAGQGNTGAPLPAGAAGKKTAFAPPSSSPVPGEASLAAPPREPLHLTRTFEPSRTAAIATSNGKGPNAGSPNASSANAGSAKASSPTAGPAPPPPLMIPESTALERVTEQASLDYPEDVRAQHVQGTVTIDVVVGKDGQVESITPLDGDMRLLAAATKAVAKWRFVPLPRDGHFVRFESHITLHLP